MRDIHCNELNINIFFASATLAVHLILYCIKPLALNKMNRIMHMFCIMCICNCIILHTVNTIPHEIDRMRHVMLSCAESIR